MPSPSMPASVMPNVAAIAVENNVDASGLPSVISEAMPESVV